MVFRKHAFLREVNKELDEVLEKEVAEKVRQAIREGLYFLVSASPIWTGQYQRNHRVGRNSIQQRVEGEPSSNNRKLGLGELALPPSEIMQREEQKIKDFRLGDRMILANGVSHAAFVEDKYAMYKRASSIIDDYLARRDKG